MLAWTALLRRGKMLMHDDDSIEHPPPLDSRLKCGVSEHALRKVLYRDMLARPSGLFRSPARFSLLAMLSGEHGADKDRDHVAALCETLNVEPPAVDANHFAADMGRFRLKWERHTEFTTYTFFIEGPFTHPFDDAVIDAVPKPWLASVPGETLVATHLAVEDHERAERSFEELSALFETDLITGNRVFGGRACAWTDFWIHDDGFGRILVRDNGLSHWQAGRLVQRLFEVVIYRMMAMLAFPRAREIRPTVANCEQHLSVILSRLSEIDDVENERQLLKQLFRLAAEIEAISVPTTYRFSASRTYYGLVRSRVKALREERIEGFQLSGDFLYRRLTPAMETCESVATRLQALSNRIAHASDLLRTRVDVALEGQNQKILQSMDRRARLQLRLQKMVEGVSIVAISYYLVSLLNYAAKSLKVTAIDFDSDIVAGVAAPLVLGAVWLTVRRIRHLITTQETPGE